ncbi:hypothetical protein [Agromyces lapidis]|uniref:Uncharacterized protein n=1 Tax=Agromyces lapidis TaxID=279574 RepID=A0ABV5SUP1_9MICO|nr:hypothetical protein [Agromyces lapidis]
MKIWVVAAMVAAATITAVAAGYGVGTLVGLQVATSSGATVEPEVPETPDTHAGDLRGDLVVREAQEVLGSYDSAGSAVAYCERGELAMGGGRLGSGSGLRAVDDGPVAGSAGSTLPIGWRIEVERIEPDRSPRYFAAYVVCRVG